MKPKMPGENPESKEIPIDFEVKIGKETTLKSVKEKLGYEHGIQFVGTQNFDLWISDLGHDAIVTKNGLIHADVKFHGYAYSMKGILTIGYYDLTSDTEKAAVRKVLEEMLKETAGT